MDKFITVTKGKDAEKLNRKVQLAGPGGIERQARQEPHQQDQDQEDEDEEDVEDVEDVEDEEDEEDEGDEGDEEEDVAVERPDTDTDTSSGPESVLNWDLSKASSADKEWLYMKPDGAYCKWCQETNTGISGGKSTFRNTPSVSKDMSSALRKHRGSATHVQAVAARATRKKAIMPKHTEQANEKILSAIQDRLLHMLWLAKEAVANCKFDSLIKMTKHCSTYTKDDGGPTHTHTHTHTHTRKSHVPYVVYARERTHTARKRLHDDTHTHTHSAHVYVLMVCMRAHGHVCVHTSGQVWAKS